MITNTCIEGIPLRTSFKTVLAPTPIAFAIFVLKVFHLEQGLKLK